MAVDSCQFYDNVANKVKNRHHIVHSYSDYEKNAEEVGLKSRMEGDEE